MNIHRMVQGVARVLALSCFCVWLPVCSGDGEDVVETGAGNRSAGGSAGSGAEGGSGGEDPENPDPNGERPSYYGDVQPILAQHCNGCHFDGGIALALETYEQVFAQRRLVGLMVSQRRMPPWLPEEGCTEYRHNRALSAEQRKRIVDWVEAGAREGDPDLAVEPAPARRELARVDLELMPEEAYLPEGEDDYRCFLIDWPPDEPVYVTGWDATPEHPAFVHHVVAGLVPPDPAVIADLEAKDQADPGPGFTCFSDPGLDLVGLERPTIIGVWDPGGHAYEFPEGTGIRVDPGARFLMQVHYHTHYVVPEPDRSSVQLTLDSEVERDAGLILFVDPKWYFQKDMPIPAGESDVMHAYSGPLATFIQNQLPFASSSDSLKLHSATLHMHQLGVDGRLAFQRAGEPEDCLLEYGGRFDYEWQEDYYFESARDILPGDQLYMECHWDNSLYNQPDPEVEGLPPVPVDVDWGLGTRDEMCLAFLYVSGG